MQCVWAYAFYAAIRGCLLVLLLDSKNQSSCLLWDVYFSSIFTAQKLTMFIRLSNFVRQRKAFNNFFKLTKMRNFKLAIVYFFLAYIIGTAVGFGTFYISETVMWISLFTIMPVVFGYFFYMYLKTSNCTPPTVLRETNILITFWILLSFILDALAYIIILPLITASKPNYTFFIDQSPWIWLNYATIIILGHISRLIFRNRLYKTVPS